MTISPCQFPGCTDNEGNPRLTDRTFCEQSERRYRRLLDWIVLDWVLLRTDLPTPVALPNNDGSDHQSPKSKIFGHPAEWASVTASEIASSLNWAEDALRDDAGHEPPPHPGVWEQGRVGHAWRYLTTPAQFDRLCTFDAAVDTAVELNDLHRKIRRMLGQTRIVQRLPTPCPWCDTAALVRDVGSIECRDCGKLIDEMHYDWLAGWIIDRLIEDYDTRGAVKLA